MNDLPPSVDLEIVGFGLNSSPAMTRMVPACVSKSARTGSPASSIVRFKEPLASPIQRRRSSSPMRFRRTSTASFAFVFHRVQETPSCPRE